MSRPQYVNGRILLREPGGIQRMATEVAARLPHVVVLTPRTARTPLSGRLWEQTVLGRQSADGVLLNPGHGGPVGHPRQINVIYDLIALTHPQSVHPGFAALMRRQLPRLIDEANVVVTLSRHVADEIMGRFGVPSARIEIVRPGVASGFARAENRADVALGLGLDPGRPVVAALLDPTPRKNSRQVALTLQALRRRRPDVQVVVAGRHHQPSFARQRFGSARDRSSEIQRQGFLDLGVATDEQLAQMYQTADVFLSLTLAEGFGLPAVEALRCGAAVVTTPVPSVNECAAGAAVVITEPNQAIGAVLQLLDDPRQRTELVATGIAALKALRWARTAQELDTLLNTVGAA